MEKIKRLRQVKMYGNTVVITLFKLDLDDLKLRVGDLVDISPLKKEVKKWISKLNQQWKTARF